MATIAELLQAANRKIAHLEQIKTAMKAAINGSGSTVGDKFADYPPSVTNGRAGIAAAITEKGVQTAANAPFDVLEANVRKIESKPTLQQVGITITSPNVEMTYYSGGVINTKTMTSSAPVEVDKGSIAAVHGKPFLQVSTTTGGITVVAETTSVSRTGELTGRTCVIRCDDTGSLNF